MRGYYYNNSGAGVVLVPYLFIGRICDNNIYISMNPDKLERLALALANEKDVVKENIRIGKWASFEISGNGIEEICSLCFNKRENDAGRIAADVCREMLNIIKLEN